MQEERDEQITLVLKGVQDVLADAVVGAYLFGSAVLGGLRPLSDLDILVVSERGTTTHDKRRLVAHLLAVSGRPRPVEVTLVVHGEIRPWRYPPRLDFQFGEWWRGRFERGELEPWPSATDPDLASLLRMVLLADAPLIGSPPAEVIDPVPRRDYVAALLQALDDVVRMIDSDTRNAVLTLARIWGSIETDEVRSKDEAANWALPRLPQHLRPVLARARAIYLGDEVDRWDDLQSEITEYVQWVLEEVKRLRDAG